MWNFWIITSRLLLILLLHLLWNSFHGCLHFCLFLLLNNRLKLVALSLHILFICGPHALIHLFSRSMHSRLPDLLTIVRYISRLVTCLAHFFRELDQIIQSFVLIIDIITKLKPNLFSWDLCNFFFHLSQVFSNLKWHALFELFWILLFLFIISLVVCHCFVHLDIRSFDLRKTCLLMYFSVNSLVRIRMWLLCFVASNLINCCPCFLAALYHSKFLYFEFDNYTKLF